MVSLAHREKVKPLGIHTVLGHINHRKLWDKSYFTYLRQNEGMLPPFIIAVGSRTRVWSAPKILNLKDAHIIDDLGRRRLSKKYGQGIAGRVAVAIGTYDYQDFEFPLAVVETEMGCSATQITLKEALYFTRDDGYQFGDKEIRSNAIYVVRAGTCAGVNSHNPAEASLTIGDILIADRSYGSVGAVLQSYLGILNFVGVPSEEIIQAIARLEPELKRTLFFDQDRNTLYTEGSTLLRLRLSEIARQRGLSFAVGSDFTKESLYAELGEDGFARLRDTFGMVSTEMEQVVIDCLAADFRQAGIPVQSALISAAIGAIPGKSFPATSDDHKLAEAAEKNIMLVAADALGAIAKALNS